MTILRVTLDLEVKQGDVATIEKTLRKADINKTLGNYVAHCTVPNMSIKGPVEVIPIGGYVHEHNGNAFQACDKCVALAQTDVFKKYPKSA